MDRLNNFLYYAILLALFAFMAFFLHSKILFVICIVFVVMPALSFLLAKAASKKITLKLSTDTLWVKKGEEAGVAFSVGNGSLFPILNCYIDFKAENGFYPNDQSNTLIVSVPCRGESKNVIPVIPVRDGVMKISVTSAEIRDLLNIFKFKTNAAASHRFYVMPEMRSGNILFGSGEFYSEDSLLVNKNVSGTVFDDIRPYAEGDRLRNIHWKLSTKSSGLMVKQYSDTVENTAILLVELYSPAIDEIIDYAYSIGRSFADRSSPFILAFASAGREQLIKIPVYNNDDLQNGIKEIYLSFLSKSDNCSLTALRREYQGGGVIYVHGKEDGKAVIETI